MTRDEYEQRRQRLDEQLRVGIELLQMAHRQQVRALDLVWATMAEEDVGMPRAEVRPAASAPAPSPPPHPAPPPRRQAWQLYTEVRDAIAKLPASFNRNDVCKQLGYEPNRSSLHRTLQDLVDEGFLSALPLHNCDHGGAGAELANALLQHKRRRMSPRASVPKHGIAYRRLSRAELQHEAALVRSSEAELRQEAWEMDHAPRGLGYSPSELHYRPGGGNNATSRGDDAISRGAFPPSGGNNAIRKGDDAISRGALPPSRGNDAFPRGGVSRQQGE